MAFHGALRDAGYAIAAGNTCIVEDIRRTALESLDPRLHKRPKILVSDLLEFASAMGAVSLLIQKWGPRQSMGCQTPKNSRPPLAPASLRYSARPEQPVLDCKGRIR